MKLDWQQSKWGSHAKPYSSEQRSRLSWQVCVCVFHICACQHQAILSGLIPLADYLQVAVDLAVAEVDGTVAVEGAASTIAAAAAAEVAAGTSSPR